MKARWFTLFACVPLIVGTMMLMSCGGVGGPNGSTASAGSNAATQNFLALLTTQQKAANYIGADACGAATCHGGTSSSAHLASRGLSGAETGQYATWKLTEHYQNGVTCESCHGPGSVHAAQPTNTDGTPNGILTFPNIAQAAVCGQCHGPQHDDWAASEHSQLITTPISEVVSSPAADGQTSRCEVCHGGLARAQYTENGTDPSVLSTTQIVALANNILNVIPNTATCSTCHDPHAKKGNLSGATGQDVQLYHSETSTDSADIGPNTIPTQYTEVNQICGQCHNGRGTTATLAYLSTAANTSRPSVHHSNQFNSLLGVGGAEDAAGPPQRTTTHASAPGQCATCHMGGGSHTMTVKTDSGCQPCHTSADATSRMAALKTEIVNDLTSLSQSMSNWAVGRGMHADDWDYTSNIASGETNPVAPTTTQEAAFPSGVLIARHNYYYLVTSGDYGVHNAAYARYLVSVSQQALTTSGIAIVQPADVANVSMDVKLSAIAAARSKSLNSASPN